MLDISLHPDFTGIQAYVSIDGEGRVKTNRSRPECRYIVSRFEFFENNLIDLFPALGAEFEHFVPDNLMKSYKAIYGDDVSWLRALGKSRFVVDIDRYLKKLQELIRKRDEHSYFRTLIASREIIGLLEPASVDKGRLAMTRSSGDSTTLSSLEPIDGCECEPVKYSHGSQTGRLTVVSGPRVLTLHKEDRAIFKPSATGKVLAQVDYISLEPRVTYLLTRDTSPRDIYEEMGERIKSKASRANLKIATISTLYGSSKVDPKLAREVSNFFAIDNIRAERLAGEKLFNLYGRPLNPEEEWLRLSHYVQSTAVDIALLGFGKFARSREIKPLFLIHDALVFECDEEVYKDMSSEDLYVDVEPLGRFYLGLSKFGRDN